MRDCEIAEVSAVFRLEDSPLTSEPLRPEIHRLVSGPCSVIEASCRVPTPPITEAAIDEIKAILKAKGLRLGEERASSPAPLPKPSPPDSAELIVASSGQRFLAPVTSRLELSAPVVVDLLCVQAPVERLRHLIGQQVRITRVAGGVNIA